MASVAPSDPAFAGQAFYTPFGLRAYDAIAYGFNSTVLWRCPRGRLVELYDENVSARHLDVGVATGSILDRCRFPVADPEITLMDLNPNSLSAAAETLARYAPRTHQANVLEPWGLPADGYDSVAICHLLHCLPGEMPEKAVAFEHAKSVLAPGGVLFGATIFGTGVDLSAAARAMIALSNQRGVVSNYGDGPEQLDAALAAAFPSHRLTVRGAVGLFTARAG
ncbi:MAG TPA: class I SAM-dependent methyltransferase [Solirubrobacterales bacterium]|nr:class I SAM-dependent methyltransferase [Solirubrobacterales bacterium]